MKTIEQHKHEERMTLMRKEFAKFWKKYRRGYLKIGETEERLAIRELRYWRSWLIQAELVKMQIAIR